MNNAELSYRKKLIEVALPPVDCDHSGCFAAEMVSFDRLTSVGSVHGLATSAVAKVVPAAVSP